MELGGQGDRIRRSGDEISNISLTVALATRLKSASKLAGTKSFSRKLDRSLWSNSLSIFPP